MKVFFPADRVNCASKEVLPASCTSKPQVSCTSVPRNGYSNQEIYEGIINLKENIISIFNIGKKQTHPIDYTA